MPLAPSPVNPSMTSATPMQIQNWTVQYAQQYGVDPGLALKVLGQESSFGSNVKNNVNNNGSFDTGPFQLNSNNFVGPGGAYVVNSGPGKGNYDPNDPQQNVQGGVATLAALTQHYNGDTDKAIAAYNNGQGAVDHAIAQFGDDYNAHLADPGYQTGVLKQTPPPVNQNAVNTQNPVGAANENPANPDPLNHTAVPYRDLEIDPISAETLSELSPSTVVNIQAPNGQLSLQQTPWYLNTNELTGNPGIHRQGYPVTFSIITDRDTGAQLTDDGTPTGKPISIRLNASMKSYDLQSSHIISKQPSRTGMHLTFWGMNADMISGQCSTGLFMNQFGITSFLNMSNITDQARQFILAAYGQDSAALNTSNDSLRIAAQDAFVEFLSLFKNNGVTWFHPQDYTQNNGQAPDQAALGNNGTATVNGQSAFSPNTGVSTAEMKARNNDVQTRGYIVMNFRSSSYLGFFKSLSWQMDADAPYRWNFSFTFQVERTLSLLYYPFPGTNLPG